MPKKMSQRAAWVYLSRLWDAANQMPDASYCVIVRGFRQGGICPCVDSLYQCDLISYEAMRRMQYRLEKHLPKRKVSELDHRWSVGKRGAQARARFCRRMAKLCEKERKKKP